MTYLSLAASNAARIQSAALAAAASNTTTTTPASTITSASPTPPSRRLTTGPAHDELSQAMFELGNNFRHGWGVAVDAVAARTYYEVAAHMGDADAMHEAAWCYLHGFGGAKDKARAAMFLRRAEGRAGKVYGNGWSVFSSFSLSSAAFWCARADEKRMSRIWKEKYDPASLA